MPTNPKGKAWSYCAKKRDGTTVDDDSALKTEGDEMMKPDEQ
jgi:hypothetical protein